MKHIFPIILALSCLAGAGGIAHGQETNPALAAAVAAQSSAPETMDLNYFKIISSRNIFNPNRRRNQPNATVRRTPRNDWFTLVGTMSYEKGEFAIFDGTRSEYKKALKAHDKIAGYTIAEIAPGGIKLAAASNQTINLPVGTQMRKPEGGRWALAGRADPNAEPTPAPEGGATNAAPTTAATVTGPDSDIMKRLMEKRLKEQ